MCILRGFATREIEEGLAEHHILLRSQAVLLDEVKKKRDVAMDMEALPVATAMNVSVGSFVYSSGKYHRGNSPKFSALIISPSEANQ
jgi:hypothetical protein